jgi:hypothetical protein
MLGNKVCQFRALSLWLLGSLQIRTHLVQEEFGKTGSVSVPPSKLPLADELTRSLRQPFAVQWQRSRGDKVTKSNRRLFNRTFDLTLTSCCCMYLGSRRASCRPPYGTAKCASEKDRAYPACYLLKSAALERCRETTLRLNCYDPQADGEHLMQLEAICHVCLMLPGKPGLRNLQSAMRYIQTVPTCDTCMHCMLQMYALHSKRTFEAGHWEGKV